MHSLPDIINKEIESLKAQIDVARSNLAVLDGAELIRSNSSGTEKYWERKERHSGEHKKTLLYTALGGPKSSRVIELKRQRFFSKQIRILEKNLKALEQAHKHLECSDPAYICSRLKPAYRDIPGITDIDDYEQFDPQKDWDPTFTKDPKHWFITHSRRRMRSLSECIWAERLEAHHIRYHYEKEFRLRDRFGTMQVVHPDFTIPCSDGSFILVEHAGCMNKDGYFNNTIKKISLYYDNGYVLGDNLIISGNYPDSYALNIGNIDNIIKAQIAPRI